MTDQLERLTLALADRYAIERELGSGGMAIVYLAHDQKLNRSVALKVVRPELAATLGAERFLREIEIAAKLTHPNILAVYDCGEADGQLYYTMPFVEGESLRDRLTREKQLPIGDALQIANEAADALGHAHSLGIVHRDIKPENILLESGHAVVSDFGIARAVTAAGGATLTETGLAVGTPAYMSPEQAAGDKGIDARSDVYSLACVLYEMLGGEPPYTGPTPQAILAKKLSEPTPRIVVVRERVPAAVEHALDRALARTPADRFATTAEFAEALRHETVGLRPGMRARFSPTRARHWRVAAAGLALVIGLGGVSWILFGRGVSRETWAREQALPRIAELIESDEWNEAYLLAAEAEAALSEDPTLASLWFRFARRADIRSKPPGAMVYRRRYGSGDEWQRLGATPIDSIWIPLGLSELRAELDGFQSVVSGFKMGLYEAGAVVSLALDSLGVLDDSVVRVPAGPFIYTLPGLEGRMDSVLGEYLIGKREVTNREYQQFVDAQGYQREEYWEHPVTRGGRTLTWSEVVELFVDRTGRPGPSTWEGGGFPRGEENHPVSGVSWYEAAAYARFVGAQLPTIAHWVKAADLSLAEAIVPRSNFEGHGTSPVGTHAGFGRYGALDMGGNVREWCWNARGEDRFILGGGWDDAPWTFTVPFAQPPLDRSRTNGIRLMWTFESDPNQQSVRSPVDLPSRDFMAERPVSDDVFTSFARSFAYDRTPLNPTVVTLDSAHPDWIRERVLVDAAYGAERMPIQVLLPRNSRSPYQVVVYYPGAYAFWSASSDEDLPRWSQWVDFVVRDGRAVLMPVYRGMFERAELDRHGERIHWRYPDESNWWRERVISWTRDLGRALDYAESRDDLDQSNAAYLGVSTGGTLAGILLGVESRFQAAILYTAGITLQRTQPEVDPVNFLPRIRLPVLMLNGKYDFNFPEETSQIPMFELLGTPDTHKRRLVHETGHRFPRTALIRESLDWLDRYLGPVR